MRSKTGQFNNMVINGLKDKSWKSKGSAITRTLQAQKQRLFGQPINSFEAMDMEGLSDVLNSLMNEGGLLARGMSPGETLVNAQSDRSGTAPAESKKGSHNNIPEFVHVNNSRWYRSLSSCLERATTYSVLSKFIPAHGVVVIEGMPKVITDPKELLALSPGIFERYQDRLLQEQVIQDSAIRPTDIVELTESNIETTQVLGEKLNHDWREKFSTNTKAVAIIHTDGKILGNFALSSEPVLVEVLQNPDFKARACTLSITTAYAEHLDVANSNAKKIGLLTPDQRLLTIKDAEAMVESGLLDKFDEGRSFEQTTVFDKVPSSINEGDEEALANYMANELQVVEGVVSQKR